MLVQHVVDRARSLVGDSGKTFIPDEAKARTIAAYAFERAYRDVGVAFKKVLDGVLTSDEPELLLPPEFRRPTLVLVAGIELEEMSFEGAVKGVNLGRNVDNDDNLTARAWRVSRPAYYFRNDSGGRYLGVSPAPVLGQQIPYVIVYDEIPNDMGMQTGQLSETLSPLYHEVLCLKTAMDYADYIPSYENALRLSQQNTDHLTELMGQMSKQNDGKLPQLVQRIKTPMDLFVELKATFRQVKRDMMDVYRVEVLEAKRNIIPMVKQQPKVFPQSLLDATNNMSRRR
jgi:hypothetical protein